jgi:hypothetical protein
MHKSLIRYNLKTFRFLFNPPNTEKHQENEVNDEEFN